MEQRVKCRGCNTARRGIKYYMIGDDMENPKPYHKTCIDKLYLEAMIQWSLREQDDDNTTRKTKTNKGLTQGRDKIAFC